MKKWIVFILIIIISFSLVYIIIPSHLVVSRVIQLNCTADGASRYLTDFSAWKLWITGDGNSNINSADSVLQHKGIKFSLGKRLFKAIDLNIGINNKAYPSSILIIPVVNDSALIKWECSFNTSVNPVTRIRQYITARNIKGSMYDILEYFREFAEKKENIYKGLNISNTTLKDTLVLASKSRIDHFPLTEEIYRTVDILKGYISSHNGVETNHPMLNITKINNNEYQYMVGIPINKPLPENKIVFLRRLVPIPNKVLTTEVKGGPESIAHAFSEVELYMNDHNLTAPVIPFEYMVTDRRTEKDSSKWITRIFYPII